MAIPPSLATQAERDAFADSLKAKIDHFDMEVPDGVNADGSKKVKVETQGESFARVMQLLGQSGVEALYAPVEDSSKRASFPLPGKPSARAAFIDYLVNQVIAKSDNDYKAKHPEYKDGDPRTPPTVEEFLGKDPKTMEMLEAAIAEEGDSAHYRNAVFLQSAKRYPGKKWKTPKDNRMLLHFAGPSASGKTFAAPFVVEQLEKSGIVQPDPKDTTDSGNIIVFSDGDNERRVSQIRQLLLQAALVKGYPGLKNLNHFTHLRVKSVVRDAALASRDTSLHVAIVKTYSEKMIPKSNVKIPDVFPGVSMSYEKSMAKYERLRKTMQIFCEVVPPTTGETDPQHELKKERFKNGIAVGGKQRAFSSDFRDETLAADKAAFGINNRNIRVESKKYGARGFKGGRMGSRRARLAYLKVTKNRSIYIPIINDRMAVVLTADGKDWIECLDKNKAFCKGKEAILITAREYNQWLLYKGRGFKADGFTPNLSPMDWLAEYQKKNGKSLPIVKVFKNGKELTGKAKTSAKDKSKDSKPPVTPYLELSDADKQDLAKIEEHLAKSSEEIGRVGRAFNHATHTAALTEMAGKIFTQSKIEAAGKIVDRLDKSGSTDTPTAVIDALTANKNKPVLDEKGNLPDWLKPALPPETHKAIATFLRQLYEQIGQLILTSKGDIQPWIIQALGEDVFENLKRHSPTQADLVMQMQSGMQASLSMATTVASADPAKPELGQLYNLVLAPLIAHQQNIYTEPQRKLIQFEKLMKQRQPDLETDRSISVRFDQRTRNMQQLIMNPRLSAQDLSDNLDRDIEAVTRHRTQAIIAHAVVEETVRSDPATRTGAPVVTSVFTPTPPMVALTSTAEAKLAPQKHEIAMTQGNGKKMTATLEERVTQHGRHPVVELTRLDPALDTAKIMAGVAFHFKDARGTEHHFFPSETQATQFFSRAIRHLRNEYGAITKEGLSAYIEESLTDRLPHIQPDQVAMLVSEVMRAYKNATEQLEPYLKNGDTHDPFERRDHLPSDAFIRLAKHQLDACVQLGSDKEAKIKLATQCFDPHFVKAVWLICDMRKYPPSIFDPEKFYDREKGWDVEPITDEERQAFKELYEAKFKALDALQEAERQPPEPDAHKLHL